MKKLNLGCGEDIRRGYINIDARHGPGVDLVLDITRKLPFADGSVGEVIAYDVLEHLIEADQEKLLVEIGRVLAKNGVLKVRMPDIEAIWEQMADDPETRNWFLYGDTEKQGIWGAHKTGHTLLSIATTFRMCGFKIVKYASENTNWLFELERQPLGKVEGVRVLRINEPVIKHFWKFWFWRYVYDEFSVPTKAVFESLFPRTRLPMARVKIGQLEYQQKRAYARKMAKMDLGL